MGTFIPCLSVRAPWAWAIVNGYKPVENRDWPTSFRGRLLIHCGKTWKEEEKHDLAVLKERHPEIPWPEAFDLGGIVGEAEMTGCVKIGRPEWGAWFCGPFGFVLEKGRPLPFVAFRGMRGFFNVPETILNRTAEDRSDLSDRTDLAELPTSQQDLPL